jgi:hypothetical protein
MNYRSAVAHGRAQLIEDPEEKVHGLQVITEHLAPGSWQHARAVNAKELASVTVLSLDLGEASVKARAGEPSDEPEDLANDAIWAGVVPVQTTFGSPVPAGYMPEGAPVPDHVRR